MTQIMGADVRHFDTPSSVNKLESGLLLMEIDYQLLSICGDIAVLARDIDDLLTLLALSIFVDRRVFAEEIHTFMRESKNLQSALKIEPRLTEARLLSWFETHRERLKQQVEALDLSSWIIPLLERLKPLRDKSLILDVMNKISIADGELHETEDALIKLTAHHWGISYVPAQPPS